MDTTTWRGTNNPTGKDIEIYPMFRSDIPLRDTIRTIDYVIDFASEQRILLLI